MDDGSISSRDQSGDHSGRGQSVMTEVSETSKGDILGPELAALDSMFQDMTRHADALIDSIRDETVDVTNDKKSSSPKEIREESTHNVPLASVHDHVDDYDSDIGENHDDDEINTEMSKLRSSSYMLRQALEDVNCVNSAIDQLESDDEEEEEHHANSTNDEEAMQEKPLHLPGAGGKNLNIGLLVVDVIVLALVFRFFYHAMYNMLDEEGRMKSPFAF